MQKELDTQWHPSFCSAMKLELKDYKDNLEYFQEYNLNSKPLQMDLLIIKKISEIKIQNEIGKIFRRHNIIEYKSRDDSMNVDTFIKVIGYACIYKANEARVDDIILEDITITLVREKTPQVLFRWLQEKNYRIVEKYKGIYYIEKKDNFPIQVVVSKELSKDAQKWLTLLNRNLDKEDLIRAIQQSNNLKIKYEKDCADAILHVVVKENQKQLSDIKKGELTMWESLKELMEPELTQAMLDGENNAHRQAIMYALRKGKTAEEIADFTGFDLEEVKVIEAEFLQLA